MASKAIAVIAGVGPGTGASIAKKFAKSYSVVLLARNPDNYTSLVQEVSDSGGRAIGISTDASDAESVKRAFEKISQEFPGAPLAAGVYNVGGQFIRKPFLELTEKEFTSGYDANGKGAFLFSQAILPKLLEQGDRAHPPTLIFTGATASLKGSALCSSFASGKFALRALAQSLAREFGPKGVHVSHAIIDGVIDIERTKAFKFDAEDAKLSPDAIARMLHDISDSSRSSPGPELGPGDLEKAPKSSLTSHPDPEVADRRSLRAEIDLNHVDLLFLVCCFISGLCDSAAYNSWNCFVSMQTGNTIFLGLGASGLPVSKPYGWLKSLISICFFVIGSFTFSRATTALGPRQRRTLISSFGIQFICVVIAAVLVQVDVVTVPNPSLSNDGSKGVVDGRLFLELIPLAFIAFQSGGQMAASRLLGFNEIPTTVLTSVYYDIVAADPTRLPSTQSTFLSNVKRNRRIAAVVFLLSGAIVGGWICRSEPGMSVVLWVASVLKLFVAFGFYFWKGKVVTDGTIVS
ncbi:hypothetical protein FQN54_006772 [Arachnomyces sp. PD_36]|nr:hypothetical protein FQN54_006772 [Arachnomyces sp. PD_36]